MICYGFWILILDFGFCLAEVGGVTEKLDGGGSGGGGGGGGGGGRLIEEEK